MKPCRPIIFLLVAFAAFVSVAEVQVINGKKYECRDGVCMLVEEAGNARSAGSGVTSTRIAQGYMSEGEFVAFLENRAESEQFAETGLWLSLLLALLGGLAMNLTPCVLPMIPINLIVIGRSARRGAAYGLGMAVAYGALGVAAAIGGLAFGDIQGNPWFNAAAAAVFVGLALALFDVWFIDLSRFRSGVKISSKLSGDGLAALLPAFGMGVVSAVLAGACVAPVLISVLLLTTDLVAKGQRLALFLPFVMGLGMALPWPFVGAGLQVLPKPGVWMKYVNRVFGVIVLGFACWYGWLAWQGVRGRADGANPTSGQESASSLLKATPATLAVQLSALDARSARPILVDCWATWCKSCSAMDRVMEDGRVKKALAPYTVLRVQAEDISELRKVKGFETIRGLPAFVVFE